ncbi:hypothetical protein [Amycolatopsis sp. NPDC051372]|uniref:hypothetical protein n=1 Tax=Amycolatopsis sp. NPDC051372 TaxID=3155669 RepID=UPI0034195F0B
MVFGVVLAFAVVFGAATWDVVVSGATEVGTEADVGVSEVVAGDADVVGSNAVVTGGTTPPVPVGAGAAPQPATSSPAARTKPSLRNTLCLLGKIPCAALSTNFRAVLQP